MENQLGRIRAESEMRQVEVSTGINSEEGLKNLQKRLTMEIGETCKVKRDMVVAPDSDAKAKFEALM